MGGPGHHGGKGPVGYVDGGVEHRGAKVVGDEDVPELEGCIGLRHGEQRHRSDSGGPRQPDDPGPGFAPLGICVVDDDAHNNVGGSVKHTGDQHNQTHRHDGDTCIVGVKQCQQGGDHAKDNVAGRIAAAVGNPGTYR